VLYIENKMICSQKINVYFWVGEMCVTQTFRCDAFKAEALSYSFVFSFREVML